VSAVVRGRIVKINQAVIDQADFFQVNGFTRVGGLTFGDLTSQLFYNNVPQPWPLANGAAISDGQVGVGKLYFHEIAGAPGNYSVRFRPNTAGYWRLILTYTAGQQIVAQDYDVMAEPTQAGGLTASFTRC
jgi:hypothetical protein